MESYPFGNDPVNSSGEIDMSDNMVCTSQIFSDYNNFNDGLIRSFGYIYSDSEPLAVEMTFYARNYSLDENVWRVVKVVLRDVTELYAKVKGNEVNSICCGVRLLRFGELWCVEIDGVYGRDEDPKTLDEVRKYGECYAVSRFVEAQEVLD